LSFFCFGAVFCFLAGIHAFATRSRLAEFIEGRDGGERDPALFRVGKAIAGAFARLGGDLEALDATLRLAGRPGNLGAQGYLGAVAFGVAFAFVLGLATWLGGVAGPWGMVILPLAAWLVPQAMVKRAAEQGRAVLRVRLMDFCSQLEQAVSGGVNEKRFVQVAAERDDLLGRELRVVARDMEIKGSLYRAFAEHFADRLGVPEAEEIGIVLRNAERKGVPLAEPLRELNRDFRSRRQMELYLRASKLKPAVTLALTLTTITAAGVWILGPLVISTFAVVGK